MSEVTRTPASSSQDATAELGNRLEQLLRFTGCVTGSLEVNSICEDALDPLATLVEAQRVTLVVLDPSSANPLERKKEWGKGFAVSPGLDPDRVVEQGAAGSALAYTDASQLPSGAVAHTTELDGPLAMVPLFVQGQLLGAVLVQRRGSVFGDFELRLLANAARQLSAAIVQSRLFTDLQASYRKLISAQEQLIRSESQGAVGGLAATLAHEIRNPLATIISSLSQLRKHAKVEGDAATLLEIAEEESLRLNRVIGALLEFARPRMPRIEEMRPAAVVKEVMRLLENSGELPASLQILVKGEADDFEALADTDLFQRAVQHLLRNAIAAVKPKTGKIEIAWTRTAGQPNGVALTITDNGCGIQPDHLSRVFEPFFSTKPTGIGLGLSVVRRIAEDHGGRVDIRSEIGRGTEVHLVFPGHATTGVMEQEDPAWL